MDEKDIKGLKVRMDELIKGIEAIDGEAISFANSKKELVEVSKDMRAIAEQLKVVINNSNHIMTEIQSVSAISTLAKLDSIEKINKELVKEQENLNQTLHTSLNEKINTLEKNNEKYYNTVKKYNMILSASAILVAIVALVIAFI